MKKKNNAGIIGTIIYLIISLAGFVGTIISLQDPNFTPLKTAQILMYLILFIYALYAYKVPHDNLLRYIMIVFIVSLLFPVYQYFQLGLEAGGCLLAAAMILMVYSTGRLNKLKENIIFFSIVTLLILLAELNHVCYLDEELHQSLNFPEIMVIFTPFILDASILISYFTRYEAHKEAGEKNQ